MFCSTLLSCLVADFTALENYELIVCTFSYKTKLSSRGGRSKLIIGGEGDSVVVDTNIHNNNIQSSDTVRARSCS